MISFYETILSAKRLYIEYYVFLELFCRKMQDKPDITEFALINQELRNGDHSTSTAFTIIGIETNKHKYSHTITHTQ